MDQEPDMPPANQQTPINDSKPLVDGDKSLAATETNRSVLIQGLAVALTCIVLSAMALDYGVLHRSAGFTIVVYALSTALIWRRAKSRPLPLIDRLVIRIGFPVYLFVMFILNAYKGMLLAEGVISWPGLF